MANEGLWIRESEEKVMGIDHAKVGFWLTICALPDLTRPIPIDLHTMCRHGEEMGRQDARNLGVKKGVEIGEASL